MNMKMPVFDWSIKLSDVLVAISMLAAGAGLYTGLNSRVSALEVGALYQKQVDAAQDHRADELKSDVISALKDVHNSVDRLGDRIDRNIIVSPRAK